MKASGNQYFHVTMWFAMMLYYFGSIFDKVTLAVRLEKMILPVETANMGAYSAQVWSAYRNDSPLRLGRHGTTTLPNLCCHSLLCSISWPTARFFYRRDQREDKLPFTIYSPSLLVALLYIIPRYTLLQFPGQRRQPPL